MATQQFKSFETDGAGQKMMPLLITDQVLVKQIQQPPGVALLLSSTPNAETDQLVETQWYPTPDQATWLADHIQQALSDASGTGANRKVRVRTTDAANAR